jgi:TRAP-type C4-dicarboxylate transport system permease small subunit
MKNNVLEAILLIVGLIVLAAILLALPLQILWNWLIYSKFGWSPEISFGEAFGLNMLAGILFRTNVNVKKD